MEFPPLREVLRKEVLDYYDGEIAQLENGLYDGVPERLEWFRSLTFGQKTVVVDFNKRHYNLE